MTDELENEYYKTEVGKEELKQNKYEKELKEYKTKLREERNIRRILKTAKEGMEREKGKIRTKRIKAIKERIGRIGKVTTGIAGIHRAMAKGIQSGEKRRRKEALQSAIVREKLLQQIIKTKKRPINIMARIEDKIPPAFSEENSIFGKRERTRMRWL